MNLIKAQISSLLLLTSFFLSACTNNPLGGSQEGTSVEQGHYPGLSAPVSADAAFSTNPNMAHSGNLTGTDPSGGALIFEIIAQPSHGSVSLNAATGAYTYTPALNVTGSDSFTYKVNNLVSNLSSKIATVRITIVAASTVPVTSGITPSSFPEDTQSGAITLSYTDPSGFPATSCTISNLTHVTVSTPCACDVLGVCTVKVTGATDFNGAGSFDFKVTTSGGVSNTSSAVFTITPVDDAPVATNITPASFPIDVQSPALTLTYSDAENDPATACTISNLNHVSVTQACACSLGVCTVKVTGSSGYIGSGSFDFTVTANGVVSNTATANLTVGSITLGFNSFSTTGNTDTALGTQPVVTAKDGSGTTVTGYTGSITLTAYSSTTCTGVVAGGLSASTNPVSASSGVATFSGVKVLKTNVQSIGASDGANSVCLGSLVISAGAPSTIAVSSGDSQSGTAGAALSSAFVAVVKDANGNVVSGATVDWAVASGGGSVSSASNSTNASGNSSSTLTLGTTAGSNTVTATIHGTSTSVTFSATGGAGSPTQILVSTGNTQTGTAGSALSSAFVAVVKDANGNLVTGATVDWAIASGGGSLSSASNSTNSSGLSSSTLTLGTTAGANTVTATIHGTATSVTFSATGTAGSPTQILVSSGNTQTGTAGSALSSAFVAVVEDVNSNVVSGVTVDWSVAAGGGSLSSSSSSTNASGLSSSTLTLGTTVGSNTVYAVIHGTSTSVTFSATGNPGTPTQISVSSGDTQSELAGYALSSAFVVIVKDANNNAVPGVTVDWAVTSGGGSLSSASNATNSSGLSSSTLTVGGTPGANSATATIHGTSTSTSFSASGVSTPKVSFARLGSTVTESGAQIGTALTLTRDICGATTTVTVTTSDVTAFSGTNYTSGSISVTMNPGQCTKTINASSFSIVNDGATTGDLYFKATISSITRGVADSKNQIAQVNIVDSAISGDFALSEPLYTANAGDTSVTLTVQRAGPVVGTASVDVQFVDASAISGTDYTGTTQTVNFAIGEDEKTVTVPITPKTYNASFIVKLVNGSSGTKMRNLSVAKVRILNDSTACNAAGSPFGGGTGTSGNPYLICTLTQLKQVTSYLSSSFKVTADIVADATLAPLGTLTGNFNGGERIIYNFSYSTTSNDMGLFNIATGTTTIQAINLMHFSATSNAQNTAGLLGNWAAYSVNVPTITNCLASGYVSVASPGYSTGILVGGLRGAGSGTPTFNLNHSLSFGLIKGYGSAGGIMGYGWEGAGGADVTNFSHLYNAANVINASQVAGGIVGSLQSRNNVTLSNLENRGYIYSVNYTGGILAWNEAIDPTGSIVGSNLINYGTIKGTSDVGGIISRDGHFTTETLSNLTNYGSISGTGNRIGGIIGSAVIDNSSMSVSISNSTNYGNIVYNGTDVGGIFGRVQQSGTAVSSDTITLTSCSNQGSISGYDTIGGLVGRWYYPGTSSTGNAGTVINSFNTGSVTASGSGGSAGGLVGIMQGIASANPTFTVTGSYSTTGTIACTTGPNCGGLVGTIDLVGTNPFILSSSYATSPVTGASGKTGGLIGRGNASGVSATVKDVYYNGTVTNSGADHTGGLIGYYSPVSGASLTLSHTYASGTVSSSTNYVGGLLGYIYAPSSDTVTVQKSYSTANVSGADFAGGILGQIQTTTTSNTFSILNSYSRGSVTVTGSKAGGIVGLFYDGNGTGHCNANLTNVYSTSILSGSGITNGLYADNSNCALTVSNSYWLKDTALNASIANDGNQRPVYDLQHTSGQATPTFTTWDFSTIWAISSGSYPTLLPSGVATTLNIAAGNSQSGTPSSTLSTPFTITVTDDNGNPIVGQTIDWSVAAGGGSLSTSSSTTNASGQATATLTLGTVVGSNTVYATIHGTPVTITFTATTSLPAPGAFTMAAAPGTGQVTVTWNSSSYASSYTLKYGTSTGSYGTTLSSVTSPQTITGLTNGTTYYFMVTATNATGSTNATAEVSAMPAYKLVTTAGPSTLNTGKCSSSAYTLTSRDYNDVTYNVPSNVTVTLSGGTGMTFYSSADTTCSGAAITTVTINSGTSTASFYAKTNIAQTMNVGGSSSVYAAFPLSVTSSWSPTRVDLFAGTYSGVGNADGTLANARFNGLNGVARDSANNIIYVTDYNSHTIRKVDVANNLVTTIVGTQGACGSADANGISASFCRPTGITYDGTRYLYVSDSANCRVRKVDTQSPYVVTTVAGTTCSSSTAGDGTATGTRFNSPGGIVYNSSKLYISDYYNVRMIDLSLASTSTSFVTLIAGAVGASGNSTNTTGTSARFNALAGIATDGTNLFVGDRLNGRVAQIALSGSYPVTTLASGLNGPTGMTVAGTNLYFMDRNTVDRISTSGGAVTGIAGLSASNLSADIDANGSAARFLVDPVSTISGLDSDSTYIYIPDNANSVVKKVLIASPYTATSVAGLMNKSAVTDGTGTAARFTQIMTSATDGTYLYIAEGAHSAVLRKMNIATGAVTTLAGITNGSGCTDGVAGVGRLGAIRGIAYYNGFLYGYDTNCGSGTLRKIDASNGTITTITSLNGVLTAGTLLTAYGSTLFVGSATNYKIWKIDLTDTSFTPTVIAGDGTGEASNAVGVGTSTRIGGLKGLWANANYLYWYDSNYCTFKKLDYGAATPTISILSGTNCNYMMVDGAAGSAVFYGWTGYSVNLVTGDSNYLYYLDNYGTMLRKIALSNGAATTMIGTSTLNSVYGLAQQADQDGVYTGTSSAPLSTLSMMPIMSPHGLFLQTYYGLRWIH